MLKKLHNMSFQLRILIKRCTERSRFEVLLYNSLTGSLAHCSVLLDFGLYPTYPDLFDLQKYLLSNFLSPHSLNYFV